MEKKLKKTTNLTLDSAKNVINLSQYNFWKAAYKLVNKILNSVLTEKKFSEKHLNKNFDNSMEEQNFLPISDQTIQTKSRQKKTFPNLLPTKSGYLKTNTPQ